MSAARSEVAFYKHLRAHFGESGSGFPLNSLESLLLHIHRCVLADHVIFIYVVNRWLLYLLRMPSSSHLNRSQIYNFAFYKLTTIQIIIRDGIYLYVYVFDH